MEEALVAYTRNGAYASHEENEKGMLKRGFLADLAVLDSDLTRISPEEIQSAEVVMTIVGGEIVYQP